MLYASGRFDRPIRTRRRVTARQRRSNAMIVRSEQRLAVLLRTFWWPVFRKSGPYAKGDMSIEHRRVTWRRTGGYALLLSNRTYLRGRKKCWAIVGFYRHRKRGMQRIVIGVHMPATVESQMRNGLVTNRTMIWQESLHRLGVEVRRLRHLYPDAQIDVVGDWNVHIANSHFRQMITDSLGLRPAQPVNSRGIPISWQDVPGTYRNRVIDGGWSTDEDAVFEVMEENDASDHKPVQIR